MAGETNKKRLADLEAAFERAKPRDRMLLEDLAILYGVTKPRFVSVRNQMPDFPEAVDRDGNKYIYLAKPAIRAMINFEKRHDALEKQRAARAAAIMGKRRAATPDDFSHSPSQLAILSRLAAEAEEREREQRLYIPAAEVAVIAGDVFGEISDFASRLANEIDPHGLLSAETRKQIDDRAKNALLRCHKRMKDILGGHAQPAADRSAPDSAGKPRSRRKRG